MANPIVFLHPTQPTVHRAVCDRAVLRMTCLPFDLQLFAGEKTEPATAKRREEARQQGNLAKSQDLGAVATLLVAMVMLRYYGADLFATFRGYMQQILGQHLNTGLNISTATMLIGHALLIALKCLVPFLMAIMLAAIGVNVAQIGWLFRFEPMTPDLNRLNPISGIQNVFSMKMVAELVKSVIKILAVVYIPYATLRDQMPFLIRFINLDPLPSYIFMGDLLFRMAMKIILILLVLALADYYFQKWRYEEGLKMSKEEIKDEYKQSEGDPKVKAKIRERQRRIATRRMMDEVPKATVVVTNPTHFAVAIHYDMEDGSSAPTVVAKGAGEIARRIKEIAQEHGVPIFDNKPLARALFKDVEIGDEIPSELWETVAAILAKVYSSRKQTA